jgi:two-component system cell cycle sensor histidine kinase PleC
MVPISTPAAFVRQGAVERHPMRGSIFNFGLQGPRFTEARLRTIVDALPVSTLLNPLGATAIFLPFLTAPAVFGTVPVSHLFTALAVHGATAIWAMILYLRYRKTFADLPRAEWQLTVLQGLLSLGWGATVWLFWESGSQINHLYTALGMVTVIWGILFTRMAHTAIFLAGILPAAALFWLRTLTAHGEVASVLDFLIPLWIAFVVTLGFIGRLRIDGAYKTAFANEDLSIALRASNDDAVHKRFEAEAANAAKTAFLANMSHELRTPLNAILGFSDIIAMQSLGAGAMARYSEYAGDIHTSGAHLLSLINDLLDIAKIESGKMEIDPRPLDATAALREIERLMMPRVRARGQTIAYAVPHDLPLVVADERAFRQIALNLISNAVKFTPEGGRIDVRCRRADEGGLLFDVADNGPGIPRDKLEKVFQPFSQIDNRYGRASGGTGLGLALVRGMAELHGGRAWLESEQGHGTTAHVYFPLVVETHGIAAVANF